MIDLYQSNLGSIRAHLAQAIASSDATEIDQETLVDFLTEFSAEFASLISVDSTEVSIHDRLSAMLTVFPNLTEAMDMNLPQAPEPSQLVKTCTGCKTRLLPTTAPVLPQYRDTLISCTTWFVYLLPFALH
jgi:hypothetical protein